MKQRACLAVVVALTVTACDGGDGSAEGSVEQWCDAASRVAELEAANPDLLDIESESAPARLSLYQSLLSDAAQVAPAAVLADANAMADGVDQFVNVAETVDYDFDQLEESEMLGAVGDLLALSDPIERVAAYNERECGITPTDLALGADSSDVGDPEPASTTTTATTLPAITTTAEAEAGEVRFTGDPDSDWCVAAREIQELNAGFETIFVSAPEEIEAFMTDALVQLEEAVAVAPPEVAEAAATSLGGIRALDEAFAEAGYDPLDADLAVLNELDAEMTSANDLLDRYNADVCGLELPDDDDDGDDSDFDPAAGTIRDQVIAELVNQGFTEDESACIFDRLDFTDPDQLTDIEAITALFVECGIDLERLAELGR